RTVGQCHTRRLLGKQRQSADRAGLRTTGVSRESGHTASDPRRATRGPTRPATDRRMMADSDFPVRYAEAIKSLPFAREIEDTRVDVVAAEDWPVTTVQPEVYIPSADLARVTDLAIALGRPLLLQGEPGCGKTRLAHSVAYALGMPLETAYV